MIGHLLNRTATIKRRTVTRDGLGGLVESFSNVGRVNLRLQPIKASEVDTYSREGELVTHKAYMDYGAGVIARDLLRFRGNDYIVRSVINTDYEDAFLVVGVELQS